MKDHLQFYIDGAWVPAAGGRTLEVVNPATEEAYARIALGETADVDKAVAAAKRAFGRFARGSRKERVELLESVIAVYKKRYDDIAEAISDEMGAPMSFARQAQAAAGLGHLSEVLRVLRDYEFDEVVNETVVTREPVGVCGFITPWNWPLNQIACKVGPALAAGCTMVIKPSEVAPISGIVFTEVMNEAGVPAGIYNMVNGDGPTVGQALATHPDIDMVSFTGSTRAGIAVARAAADTVKRVAQELGGKSPNIILPDADIVRAVTHGTRQCFSNSGQSCNAPTRMLVPADRQEEAIAVAREVAAATVVGDPRAEGTTIGPVVSKVQFDKIQRLIEQGIAEGARLVAGGPGRPEHLNRGYYIRPTVFADVRNDMTIAREEIFGPVLSILPYRDEEEAIAIANDTVYGLSSYVTSGDLDHARAVARRIRAGMVHINGSPGDLAAPFGGYKQSGNGREWGRYGLEDFLEVKSMFGYNSKSA
ncbi:aldehyde dehydrogenase family protein [Chelatococcus sp. GW1]|uniref:aldehyde dehydrogenase family protein n=1 Tax=Chelatococcus sp. GW1 TaxID=1211115 RepID=UPI000300F03E|nr:aldehyde dehydrogenase family protein [Chelatococcus sp. GW1]